ncbi:hypothetical protein C900_03409 [Fulvivirga imtechensis AK7]|uniref:Uncharacterized protein n=1 Tax=Fulvivirga imtechensis AK7 TaxID=1237149 RepID=L8JPD6_9BACT|nr:hypothetical protein C900_03409 [Fulvivirga imtechensis AK7]
MAGHWKFHTVYVATNNFSFSTFADPRHRTLRQTPHQFKVKHTGSCVIAC